MRDILAFGERPENNRDGFPPPECFLAPGQGPERLAACQRGTAGESVVLWGDSHAAHLYSGLVERLDGKARLTTWTVSACPPLVGGTDNGVVCGEVTQAIRARIAAARPDRVILAAVWGHYDWQRVASTIAALKAAGVANIELVGPVPRWHPSLPVVLARFGQPMAELPRRSRLGLDPRMAELDREMARFAAERGIAYRSAYAALCDGEGCLVRLGDRPETMLHWDVSHLTPIGSRELAARLWP